MLKMTDSLDLEFRQGTRADEFFDYINEINDGDILSYRYNPRDWSAEENELKDYLEESNHFGYPYTVWNEYRANNVYPSQKEFISKTYPVIIELVENYVRRFALGKGLTDVAIEIVCKKVTINRIARAYISFLHEEYAVLKTLDLVPNIQIYTAPVIDLHFGVDYIVVGLDDYGDLRTYNIHVLKDSPSALSFYNQKSKMVNYTIDVKDKKGALHNITIQRDFKNEIIYKYPAESSYVYGKKTKSIGDFHVPMDTVEMNYNPNKYRSNNIADIVLLAALDESPKAELFEESTLKKLLDLDIEGITYLTNI